jgi:hypothetical protein
MKIRFLQVISETKPNKYKINKIIQSLSEYVFRHEKKSKHSASKGEIVETTTAS